MYLSGIWHSRRDRERQEETPSCGQIAVKTWSLAAANTPVTQRRGAKRRAHRPPIFREIVASAARPLAVGLQAPSRRKRVRADAHRSGCLSWGKCPQLGRIYLMRL